MEWGVLRLGPDQGTAQPGSATSTLPGFDRTSPIEITFRMFWVDGLPEAAVPLGSRAADSWFRTMGQKASAGCKAIGVCQHVLRSASVGEHRWMDGLSKKKARLWTQGPDLELAGRPL